MKCGSSAHNLSHSAGRILEEVIAQTSVDGKGNVGFAREHKGKFIGFRLICLEQFIDWDLAGKD